ncbi:MAG: SprT family zinc-dependent metalloprotease [Bacteroidota bacterium]
MSEFKNQYQVEYGTTTIDFTLEFSARKSLGITVTPNLDVKVVAPYNSSIKKIKEKIENKARWIVRQKEYFGEFLPKTPAREYVNGETHLYAGRQYRLKIIASRKNSVKLNGGSLVVSTSKKEDRNYTKLLLDQWYREHAIRLFEWRITQNLSKFSKFKLDFPKLVVRRMEKRWGSCTPGKKIILNPEIIKAPVKCIDYVVIHELCHLVHHNHSPEFYTLQNKIMPDNEKWKNRLEQFLI